MKQKDEFIARLLTCRQEAQGYGRKEFKVSHRQGIFYGVNAEVIWLFQLIGGLEVVFLIWIRIDQSGEQGSPEMSPTDLVFEN